jgi:hypothetical protein
VTPLKVQIVISRFQGPKKVSSMPYSLSVNTVGTAGHASIRMGAQVAVSVLSGQKSPGQAAGVPQIGPIQYRDIGTNIDCTAIPMSGGRYQLNITLDDSSLYPDDQSVNGGARESPSFRSFRTSDSVVVKDGETAELTQAVDKLTGEVLKIDVTLTVVK